MKTEKNRKYKGSVLLTVVMVMSLLIVFLTSALILASAASNRAHRTYSTSQAEYTARAAIQSFAKSMELNDGIAAAVENMGNSATADTFYPEVQINNPALGTVGCYRVDAGHQGEFYPGHIMVTPVSNYDAYEFDGEKWVQMRGVRISATVQVGREEKTVSAYIRKQAPFKSESKESKIKGLQTAGDSTFTTTAGVYTGALALGIVEPRGNFEINNTSIFDTELIYVNGDFKITANSNIGVQSKEFEFVVMGNLHLDNSNFMTVNYAATDNQDIKDTPYMYVDGGMTVGSSLDIPAANGSPLNFFIGTMHTPDNVKISGDVYLMDGYDPSSSYTSNGKTFTKGNNTLGSTTGASLYKWSSSVVNKNAPTYTSFGGNIFCNGNLNLQQVSVADSVRVAGDCHIIGDTETKIGGDLVVAGTLYIDGSKDPNVTGTIYCDNIVKSSASASSDYVSKDSIDHPAEDIVLADCQRFDNAKRECYLYKPSEHGYSPTGNDWDLKCFDLNGNELTEYNDARNTTYAYRWIAPLPDGVDPATLGYEELGNYLEKEPMTSWRTWETKPDTSYYVEKDNIVVEKDASDQYQIVDSVDTYVPTDDAYFWYNCASGTKVNEGDVVTHVPAYKTRRNLDGSDSEINTTAPRTWYRVSDGAIVDEYTATHSASAHTISGAVPYTGSNKIAYPSSLTREAIYGTGSEENGTFTAAPDATRIIKGLGEVQDAIGYSVDESTGARGFSSATYYTEIPNKELLTPVAYTGQGEVSLTSNQYLDLTNKTVSNNLTIIPTGTAWVLCDKTKVASDKHIVVNDLSGAVNFMIKGKWDLGERVVVTNDVLWKRAKDKSEMDVYENEKININYYGAAGSTISYYNEDLICGTAKCPYTAITVPPDGGTTVQGFAKVNWYDKAGGALQGTYEHPHWIGSALVKGVSGANNFTLVYTESGGGGAAETTSEIVSGVGTYSIGYYSEF